MKEVPVDMVLIAGGRQDFETPQAKALCEFLYKAGLAYQIIRQAGEAGYVEMESQIEQCSVFLVLIGAELNASTWLNHCLTYAWKLRGIRMDRRPSLVGLAMPGWQLPAGLKPLEGELHILDAFEYLLHG